MSDHCFGGGGRRSGRVTKPTDRLVIAASKGVHKKSGSGRSRRVSCGRGGDAQPSTHKSADRGKVAAFVKATHEDAGLEEGLVGGLADAAAQGHGDERYLRQVGPGVDDVKVLAVVGVHGAEDVFLQFLVGQVDVGQGRMVKPRSARPSSPAISTFIASPSRIFTSMSGYSA